VIHPAIAATHGQAAPESPSHYIRTAWRGLAPQDLAVVRARLEAWMAATGAQPYTGRTASCLQRLHNPRHRGGLCCLDASWASTFDHPEWWRMPGGGALLTCHPYDTPSEWWQERARALCEKHTLEMTVDHAATWYYPPHTALVVVRARAPRDTGRA